MSSATLYEEVIAKFLAFVHEDAQVPPEIADGIQVLVGKSETPSLEELVALLSTDPGKEANDGVA